MTTIVHDQSFTVTTGMIVSGSGNFGSKSHSAPTIVDFGEDGINSLGAHWTTAKPAGTAAGTLPRNRALPHDNAGTSSGVPHARAASAICGAAPGGGGAYDTTNMFLSRDFIITAADLPCYSYWTYYWRVANNHIFGGGSPADDNYKNYGYSTGNDGIYGGLPNNWYASFNGEGTTQDGRFFQNNTNAPLEGVINDDTGEIGSTAVLDNTSHWGQITMPNPAAGWIRVEILVKWSTSAGGGFYRDWYNGVQEFNYTSRTESLTIGGWADNTGGNFPRSEGIGGFRRSLSSQNMCYYHGVIHDRDANDGRFVLTNHSVWGSSTIFEPLPYTSWASGSVDLTCKGGALPEGTVHLHFRSTENGDKYLGTLTLSDEGGAGSGLLPLISHAGSMGGGTLSARRALGRHPQRRIWTPGGSRTAAGILLPRR